MLARNLVCSSTSTIIRWSTRRMFGLLPLPLLLFFRAQPYEGKCFIMDGVLLGGMIGGWGALVTNI